MITDRRAPSVSALGYLALFETFDLKCPAPRVSSRSSSSARGTSRSVDARGFEEVLYPKSSYKPRTGLADNLEFALKNEPLDLAVLAALFELEPAQRELQAWLAASPSSKYARIAGHLYEWLTGKSLDYRLPAGVARVPVLDPNAYVVGPSDSDRRFGVIHNLIGSRSMSPLVRRTPTIEALLSGNLKQRVASAIEAIDPRLLDRAVTYLYLSETKSSFAIEREIPSHERRERFRRLLEQAGAPGALTEDAWIAWHREILGANLRQESSFRIRQNWLSKGSSSRDLVDYIPPAPDDVHELMQAVADIAEQGARGLLEPVIAAACASFGMVFVHPFLDGNGRLHRFLLHHILRQCGVTPERVVLPISAALESKLAEYTAVLQAYSEPRTRLLDYRLEPDSNTIHVRGPQPAWLYAYFDATRLCELVVQCIDRALGVDLPAELSWLRCYDQAMQELTGWLDGVGRSDLDLLVRLVVKNHGRLSKTKRSQFEQCKDVEIAKAEEIIGEAFAPWIKKYAGGDAMTDLGAEAHPSAAAGAGSGTAAGGSTTEVAAAPVARWTSRSRTG